MKIPKDILKEYPHLKKDSILIAYRGSVAHGMYVPNSDPNSIDDIDAVAIIIPTIDHYYGLKSFGSRGTQVIFPGDDPPESNKEWDIVIYEFKKVINMLLNSNPNILSLLWLSKDKYIKKTRLGNYLIKNRDLFVSKKIFHSFTGYAYDQMKKMEKSAYKGYMGEKRKKLVEKYGYDPKNASHLIRLLRMSIEFLNEGTFYVDRTDIDASELLKIKSGEWSLDQVKNEANKLFLEAEKAYNRSTLPDEVDFDKVNRVCVRILKRHFFNMGMI